MEVDLPGCLGVEFTELSCRCHPTETRWILRTPLAVIGGGAQPASDTHTQKGPWATSKMIGECSEVKFALGWDWDDVNQSSPQDVCDRVEMMLSSYIIKKTTRTNKQTDSNADILRRSLWYREQFSTSHILTHLIFTVNAVITSILQVREVRYRQNKTNKQNQAHQRWDQHPSSAVFKQNIQTGLPGKAFFLFFF